MIGWLTASPPERRLLPGGRLSAPTPWLIAIMMFVMVTVAAAGMALAGSARTLRDGIAHRYMIEIADGRAAAPAALATARAAPGVLKATQIPEAELRATLERWLGPAAARAEGGLPLPSLIDLDLAPASDPADIAARIRRVAPGARLVSHQGRVAPILGAMRALAWLALALVALIALATAAAVVLATRAALNANRTTLEIMHGIGATDLQVARLFQRRIALDALAGGIAGTAAAAAVLVLVAGGLGGLGEFVGQRLLGLRDLVLLALLPLVAAVLATLVARSTVLRALRAQL
jgi:cell division transport system permease protein